MSSEPVINVALVVAALVAALQLLRSFGVNISDEQTKAIVEFATTILQVAVVIGGGVFARSFVTPVKD
jgi:uncharacterized membrane protein